MDDFEKKTLENLKNFDFKTLIFKESYVEFVNHNNFRQAFIMEQSEKDKFYVSIQNHQGTPEIPINMLNFFNENDYPEEIKIRNHLLNYELQENNIKQIIYSIEQKLKLFDIKLSSRKANNSFKKGNNVNNTNNSSSNKSKLPDKNGKSIDIRGYMIYQFLFGYLVDCLALINYKLSQRHLGDDDKNLFILILDIVIYMIDVVIKNIKKYKTAYNNKKLLIVSPLHGILIGFDLLIVNLINKYQFEYSQLPDLDSKLTEVLNLIYEVILASKSNHIPLPSLVILLKFITFDKVKEKIIKYKMDTTFHILKEHLENLNENELKYYKKNSDVKNVCKEIVSNLSNKGKNLKTLVDNAYYSFLLSCLKCKNLEKKMNALNDISDIINEFRGNNEPNIILKQFIKENNVLDIIFEESIHDEIIKRSITLFKYFAKFDLIDDKIIEKIIERQTNDLMKKILFGIISELPRQKKDNLFERLTKGIKLNDKNSIETLSSLTESCFNNSIINENNEKNKKEKNDKNDKNEIKIKKDKNYYGLNILFDYIIKYFDNTKKYDENNVDMAVDCFEQVIYKITRHGFDIDDVFFFIDKLFNNIKNNNKHNSVIQSIKLIQKLLNILRKIKNISDIIKYLKKLDEKYDIITLLINDLIRYMELLPNDYTNEKCKDKIYEGIYPHNINIEERLKIIFYFFKKKVNNYELNVKGKKHIEIIYQKLKSKKYKEEQKKFYEIFTRNINDIDDTILEDFFKDILQNKEQFNLKEVNNNESIKLIIQTFQKVNENKKALIYDGRNIRIEGGAQIEGFDILFDLLTQNPDKDVQNKISKLLCDVCLSFKDYNNPKIPDYWKMYFKRINKYLDNINKSNDKVAFNGIIKLLNQIYSFSSNCYGKIPSREDYRLTTDQFKIYHFLRYGTKNEYRLKVGNNDRIIDMRFKLGYYFDIPVNNVTFIDSSGKKYSLNNDLENFVEIFNHPKYFEDKGFIYVKVNEEPFQYLQMKDNPKDLIEKNDNIYKILIDNLRIDLKNNKEEDAENKNKQKIWNIISKLPKNYYFENRLKKYGNREKTKENDLNEILDNKQKYLLTYSLQCIYIFLFDKNKEKDKQVNQILPNKNEYLNNFIGIYHLDKLIFDILSNINIDKNNCEPIQIECLTNIIDVLNEIEKFKENGGANFENIFEKKDLLNNTLKKLTDIISNLLVLNYTKYKEYINQINDDSNDKNINNNERNQNINENIAKIIEHIFNFIEEITKGKMSYMDYLFNNKEIFITIFIYNYIKCENDESRKKIDEFLTKNYIRNNFYIHKYFEIILTVDIFNYLVKNDKAGRYFHAISSIMKRYNEEISKAKIYKTPEPLDRDTNIESKNTKQSKQIIDIIIKYIKEECEKKEENIEETCEEKEVRILIKNKENFKEGIILFLANIINLNQKELVEYIAKKVDVFDLFLNKCILRKCQEKPLEKKEPFCRISQSQNAVYKLLLIISKNIPNNELYIKIIDQLNKYHQLGFWKTYNVRNWDLESKEMQKGKYIGLKNMTATCYLNSIIQQLFMIPQFRETILKINNSSKNNILYELQLLFSALKIYEFAYYDPRSFVVANKLNFCEQMDADEFYGTLIDKIENDIKKMYSKTTPQNPQSNSTKTPKDSKQENYKYKNIFNYFFGIKVLDELKFVDCGHKRYNEFFYNSIQLEIKEFNNIHDSLKNYFKTEIMDGDNKINCEQCKVKMTCHKHLIFKSLPNVLVFALKRFEFDYNTMLKYKLNKYFEFPYKLDMKDYLIENHKEVNTEYELTGITIHYGVVDFGHYYDIIKGPNNKWYKFNDISVTEFKEEDIPLEAFGDKGVSEEDSFKEKDKGKNNAYILIYKKKDFESNIIKDKNNSEIAFPPYDKYSNINEIIKNDINSKLLESWTIKNITSTVYQNFVLQLLEFDLAKIFDSNIAKNYSSFKDLLIKDGYISENNNYIKNNYIDTNNNNNKVFDFCLKYYFNVILRISRRVQDRITNLNYFEIFRDIIKIYIEKDINKAKYLLEEFSNTECINEYLVCCPIIDSIKDCLDIILKAYNLIFRHSNQNDSFIFEFMNSIITYIDKNIRKMSLEAINHLLIQIISIGGQRFINYLKKKNYEKWIESFFGNNKEIDNFINESVFPTLHSEHSILTYKEYKITNDINKLNEETDMNDQHFYSKLNNVQMNQNLIKELHQIFNN